MNDINVEKRTPEEIAKDIAETTMKLNELIKEGGKYVNLILRIKHNTYLLQNSDYPALDLQICTQTPIWNSSQGWGVYSFSYGDL